MEEKVLVQAWNEVLCICRESTERKSTPVKAESILRGNGCSMGIDDVYMSSIIRVQTTYSCLQRNFIFNFTL